MSYPEYSAGRLMQREVVAAPQFWTVGQTIDHFRKDGDELPELFFDIYVVDPSFKPVGAVPVSLLLRTKRDVPLAQIMEPVTEIAVDLDQEEVADPHPVQPEGLHEEAHLFFRSAYDDSAIILGDYLLAHAQVKFVQVPLNG